MNGQAVWSMVQARVKAAMTAEDYALGIAPLRFKQSDEHAVVLVAPDGATANFADTIYAQEIAEEWQAVTRVLFRPNVFVELDPCVAAAAKKTASGSTWPEYRKEVRTSFLKHLNERVPVRQQLYSHERRAIRELFDRRVSLNKVIVGIRRTFEYARWNNRTITSFNYCKPRIESAVREREF